MRNSSIDYFLKSVGFLVGTLVCFGILFGLVCLHTSCKSSASPGQTQPNPPTPENECPFTIYYALNESHSTDWVQRLPDGRLVVVLGNVGQEPVSTAENVYSYNLLHQPIR